MTDETAVFEDTIADIAEMAHNAAGNPQPLMQGTFALYPMPDGGVMFVTDIAPGGQVPEGVQHYRVPAGFLRAVGAMAGGGGKMSALRAMMGGRRKAIGNGGE